MFLQESFEEEAVEFCMIYIDPLVYTFWAIALVVFVLNTYNKPELRFFIITFVSIIAAGIMMILQAYAIEAIFIFIAGITSVFAIYYYRAKTKINQKGAI